MDNQIDTSKAFALKLEMASEQFGLLRALVSTELLIVNNPNSTAIKGVHHNLRAESCIVDALANEFLFNAVRAYRICKHGAGELGIPRVQRKNFMNSLAHITNVRDVNEHGYDFSTGLRGKTSRPSMHSHENESVILDETSVVILGPDKILKGPLNLVEVAKPIEAMRQIAGFASQCSAPK